jgi:hypothetical protein
LYKVFTIIYTIDTVTNVVVIKFSQIFSEKCHFSLILCICKIGTILFAYIRVHCYKMFSMAIIAQSPAHLKLQYEEKFWKKLKFFWSGSNGGGPQYIRVSYLAPKFVRDFLPGAHSIKLLYLFYCYICTLKGVYAKTFYAVCPELVCCQNLKLFLIVSYNIIFKNVNRPWTNGNYFFILRPNYSD